MEKKFDPGDDEKKREKGFHSEEIEDAIIKLRTAVESISHNLNVLISEYSGGEGPKTIIEKPLGLTNSGDDSPINRQSLMTVLQEAPQEIREIASKINEVEKQVEHLREILL